MFRFSIADCCSENTGMHLTSFALVGSQLHHIVPLVRVRRLKLLLPFLGISQILVVSVTAALHALTSLTEQEQACDGNSI